MKNALELIITFFTFLYLLPLSLQAQIITGRYTYDLKGVDNIKVEWIREDGYNLRTITNDSGYYSLSLTDVKNDQSITPIKRIISSFGSKDGNAEITYILPESGETEICVYDITGAEVIQLNKGFEQQGVHKTFWNLRNSLGERLTTGIYPYSIKSAGNSVFGSVAYINGLVFGSAKRDRNFPAEIPAVKKINDTPMIRFTDVSEKRTNLFHTYAAPCNPKQDTIINIKGIPYVLLPTPFGGFSGPVETVKDYVQFQAIETIGGGPYAKNLYENGPVLIYVENPQNGGELHNTTLDSAIAETNSTAQRPLFERKATPYTGTEKRTIVNLKYDPDMGPDGTTHIWGYEQINGIYRLTSYEIKINHSRYQNYENILSLMLHELDRVINLGGNEGSVVPSVLIGASLSQGRTIHLSYIDIEKNKILYDADPGTIFQYYLRTAGE